MKKSKYLPSDAKGRPAIPSMGTTNHDCGGVGIDGGARRERPGEQSKHFDIFERERQSNRARERNCLSKKPLVFYEIGSSITQRETEVRV